MISVKNNTIQNSQVKVIIHAIRGVKQVLIEKFEKVSEEIQKLSPRKSSCREDEEKPSNELVKMTNRKVIKEQREQGCKENQVLLEYFLLI
jgi:hypothetical protein